MNAFQPRCDRLTVDTPDGAMQLFAAQAVSAPRATVIVLQEAFGVNAHIQSVSARFASAGFRALAPDLFHRTPEHAIVAYDERDRAMQLIGELGPDQIVGDVTAAADLAKDLDPAGAVVACGFCFGGRAAFTATCSVPRLDGAVCFYGPGVAEGPHAVLDRATEQQPPLPLFYGAADPTIPLDHVEAIAAALDTAGSRYEQVVYEDAGHAFACDARAAMYRPQPALDSWMRTVAFVAQAAR